MSFRHRHKCHCQQSVSQSVSQPASQSVSQSFSQSSVSQSGTKSSTHRNLRPQWIFLLWKLNLWLPGIEPSTLGFQPSTHPWYYTHESYQHKISRQMHRLFLYWCIQLKNNGNQICWLVHKSERQESSNQGFGTRQEFLDKQLYSVKNIRSYEWVFGEGFISPGGLETTIVSTLIQAISIEPLWVHYCLEALPTQHGYCVGFSRRSATDNCELRTCPGSLCGG